MKGLSRGFLILGLMFLVSSAPKTSVYQVISSHPHDVEELRPYVETVKQDGRLWLVQLKRTAPARVLAHLREIHGNEVRHYEAPVLKGGLANGQITDFTLLLDKAAIKTDVELLSQFKTRLVGTPDNQKATALIKDVFSKLGYQVTETCYRSGACSVVADKKGEADGAGVILLMAHLDSVGKNFAGADDNASGVAVMLEIAKALKTYGNQNTLRFFATNGEESGLLGAKAYAEALTKSGEIKNVILAINMDMVGYNSNGVVELETDAQYEGLAQWFANLAFTYTSLTSKITIGAWGSDHVPFIKGGVPTLLTIEDWSTKTPCYHLECDKPGTLNYDYATEIAKLNLAAIMTKDQE